MYCYDSDIYNIMLLVCLLLQRKRWHVLESLMMSESAFLISLTTVVNVRPLHTYTPVQQRQTQHKSSLLAPLYAQVFTPQMTRGGCPWCKCLEVERG